MLQAASATAPAERLRKNVHECTPTKRNLSWALAVQPRAAAQAQLARTLAKMRLATLQRLVQPVDRRAFAHARLTDHFENAAQVGGRIGSASVDLSSDSFELEERDGAHFGWAARCC